MSLLIRLEVGAPNLSNSRLRSTYEREEVYWMYFMILFLLEGG
ncbi:hypothetical protein PP707_07165 [Acetobacter pasteurianus]|nr:hypothetical protein [Acetobacter pasteurianus]